LGLGHSDPGEDGWFTEWLMECGRVCREVVSRGILDHVDDCLVRRYLSTSGPS
jgi:hypothetical protein